MMKKVLVYMDKELIGVENDSTDYLVRNIGNDNYFDIKVSSEENPELAKDYDVVLCRFDLPLKREFLKELSKYDDGDRLFINPPETKLNYSNKGYLKKFADNGILPDTHIGSNPYEIAEFMRDLKSDVISKPIEANKGRGIEKIDGRRSLSELVEDSIRLTNNGSEEIVVQRFIDKIEEYGDKRVNVLFYEPINAVLRFPGDNSFLCNTSAGGSSVKTSITDKDREIIEKIEPFLRENRGVWAGVDIIGPYLGEINFPSPGLLYRTDIFNENKEGTNYLIENIKKWSPKYDN